MGQMPHRKSGISGLIHVLSPLCSVGAPPLLMLFTSPFSALILRLIAK